MIRAILLVAGETIITPVEPLPARLHGAFTARGVPGLTIDRVRAAIDDSWALVGSLAPPGVERYRTKPGGSVQYWREMLLDVASRMGARLSDAEAEATYFSLCEPHSWRVFPEVKETLAALRARGYALAIASNWDRGLPDILRGLGLLDDFAALGVSEIVGHEKPGAAFFEHILAELGVGPEEAVHVGDRLVDDVEGATGAGLGAYLIDRNRAHPDAPWVLRSLGDLLDCLPAS
ncbi:MAG: HAD-IA family hydrolase [Acidobacteriota bacterium]